MDRWTKFKPISKDERHFRICIEFSCEKKGADDVADDIFSNEGECIRTVINGIAEPILNRPASIYLEEKHEEGETDGPKKNNRD